MTEAPRRMWQLFEPLHAVTYFTGGARGVGRPGPAGVLDGLCRAAGRAPGSRGGRLIDADHRLTVAGRGLHADVERATDAVAASPWRHLGGATDTLATLLAPLAASVVATTLPVPNAIGLLPDAT